MVSISISTSITAVLGYLDHMNPEIAAIARERYACLTPWQSDSATYGRMARSTRYQSCTHEVVRMLNELLNKRLEYVPHDGEHLLDAIQNARLIPTPNTTTGRCISHASWNLRDTQLFDTLRTLLTSGWAPGKKAVVWAHGASSASSWQRRGLSGRSA